MHSLCAVRFTISLSCWCGGDDVEVLACVSCSTSNNIEKFSHCSPIWPSSSSSCPHHHPSHLLTHRYHHPSSNPALHTVNMRAINRCADGQKTMEKRLTLGDSLTAESSTDPTQSSPWNVTGSPRASGPELEEYVPIVLFPARQK